MSETITPHPGDSEEHVEEHDVNRHPDDTVETIEEDDAPRQPDEIVNRCQRQLVMS